MIRNAHNPTEISDGSESYRSRENLATGSESSFAVSSVFRFFHLIWFPWKLGMCMVCVCMHTPCICGIHKYMSRYILGFPGGSDGVCLQRWRPVFNPWVRKIPWRRRWQPTPLFLPGKFHGQRSLEGYSPRGRKELDMTEQLTYVWAKRPQ